MIKSQNLTKPLFKVSCQAYLRQTTDTQIKYVYLWQLQTNVNNLLFDKCAVTTNANIDNDHSKHEKPFFSSMQEMSGRAQVETKLDVFFIV